MTVGLILVSHSADLARGSAELARQMAPSVMIAPAGGTDDGGIGTSFDLINEAIGQADTGEGAVLLYDLGSAVLTAEMAVEFLDPEAAARIRIVDAPLVEGAVSAAVTAEGGGDLDQVVASARGAAGAADAAEPPPVQPQPESVAPVAADSWDHVVKATVSVVNPLGLHARPVAALIRVLSGWDVQVTIGRPGQTPVDLRAVLRVVGLALRGGDTVEITASGPDAPDAAATVTALITGGFGETVDLPRRIAPAAMGAAPARLGNAGALRPVGGPAIVDSVLRATPGGAWPGHWTVGAPRPRPPATRRG